MSIYIIFTSNLHHICYLCLLQESLIHAGDLGRDYEHCVELQKKANDHESAVSTEYIIYRVNCHI